MTDTYRQAASLLLLRSSGSSPDTCEVLLLHKPRKKDAWQLPQGGMESGESPEDCAVRELEEEAGITDVNIVGASRRVYQYDFPASYRRFRPDHICGQQIFFVFGKVDHPVEVSVDGVEVDDHVWVDVEEVKTYIKRKEYLQLVTDMFHEALEMCR